MSEPVLVVDFGTTTSSAVLVSTDGTQIVREPGGDRDLWPSAVCVDVDEVVVGTAATDRQRFDPSAFRSEFKADLGDPCPIPIGAKSYLPEELVTELLSAIAAEAAALRGAPVRHAVLTVPASYDLGDPRRDLMIAAGERVGFSEVELLPEPVAAAFAPTRGAPFTPGEVVLVYDFGGGTFDAALIEIAADGRHRVLGHAAEAACGGRDMDTALRRRLRELGGQPLTDLLTADPEAAADTAVDLAEMVRRIKYRLSDTTVWKERLPAAGLRVEMTRTELAQLCRPVLEQTVRCCETLIAAHPQRPAAALLVGGTCRMPMVAEAVEAELGLAPHFARDVSTAVAQGAAAWAARAGERAGGPAPARADERPLRWQLPGDTGTLVRMLVEPGSTYAAEAALAAVRLADGTLYRLRADAAPGTVLRGHADIGDPVTSGDWLVTVRSSAPETAAETPRYGWVIPAPSNGLICAVPGARSVAYTAGGTLLVASGTDGVHVIDAETGSLVRTVATGDGIPVAAVRDDELVLMGQGDTLTAVSVKAGHELFRLALGSPVVDLACSSAGMVVAVLLDDGETPVLAWNGATYRQVATLPPSVSVVDHPSAARIAVDPEGTRIARYAAGSIDVWGVSARSRRRTTSGVDVEVREGIAGVAAPGGITGRLTFRPNGPYLAAACDDGVVIWHTDDPAEPARLMAQPGVVDVAWEPTTGETLLTVDAGGVRFWDVDSQMVLIMLGTARGVAVSSSPDRRFIATADPQSNTVTVVPLPADDTL